MAEGRFFRFRPVFISFLFFVVGFLATNGAIYVFSKNSSDSLVGQVLGIVATPTPEPTATPVPTLTPTPTPTNTPTPTSTPTPIPPTATPTPTEVPSPTPTPVTIDANSDEIWGRLAACESGNNWSIDTGNGYYGGLQFSQGAWESVGGVGNPAHASRDEQIEKGRLLQERRGWGVWGECAKNLGLN